SSKAESEVVNQIKGTVDTHTTEISQNATAITSKADQTEVDTVKGTVNTHTTKISQNATAISSKAAQTEVDTVKGTVSSHTSTLSQHAKDISARLTQTQVNSLVNDKGYSTVSYVDTQMSATAGAIRTEMTAVESKIDGLQIGGRNLLPQSGNFTGAPNSFWVENGGGLTYDASSQYNGFGTVKTTVGEGIVGQWLKLENGVDYTYSITFKADKAFIGDHRVPLHYHAGKN